MTREFDAVQSVSLAPSTLAPASINAMRPAAPARDRRSNSVVMLPLLAVWAKPYMVKFSTLSIGESSRTSSHLTSSSSAMTWASAVPTCWPISAFTICIVTLPSGVSVNQIEGVKLDTACAVAVLLPKAGRPMLRNVPAAVAAERTRNSRRLMADCVDLTMTSSPSCHLGGSVHDLGSSFHGADDARVGGATAEI